MAWAQNKASGIYIAKLGYKIMIASDEQIEVWWWSKICKLKHQNRPRYYYGYLLKIGYGHGT
jgi:hypothetical protein